MDACLWNTPLYHHAGVYGIINTLNERIYIGTTKESFKVRWQRHCADLDRGTHWISLLQSDWHACGSDAFAFEVIEVLPRTSFEFHSRERYWQRVFYQSGNVYHRSLHTQIKTHTDIEQYNWHLTIAFGIGKGYTKTEIITGLRGYNGRKHREASAMYDLVLRELGLVAETKAPRTIHRSRKRRQHVLSSSPDASTLLPYWTPHIIQGIGAGKPKTEIVKGLPGYSGRKHQLASDAYDQVMHELGLVLEGKDS